MKLAPHLLLAFIAPLFSGCGSSEVPEAVKDEGIRMPMDWQAVGL